ncbi:hypothetical protein [Actinomadura sp. NPDC049753]|uniref:hypothetical protein n=1 Tax=Actinomadura sp. NPDC049753 TaxID=3154739 RepID=UPI00341E2634
MQQDPTAITVGAVITLALFGLIAFIVHRTQNAPAGRPALVLTAAATVLAALPAILFALYGG